MPIWRISSSWVSSQSTCSSSDASMFVEQVAGAVVAALDGQGDAVVEALDRRVLQRQVDLELLGHVSPTRTLFRRCRFGTPSKNRMRSISCSACFISSIDSSRLLGQPLVAPVLAHLGVDEVLVDRVSSAVSTSLSSSMMSPSPRIPYNVGESIRQQGFAGGAVGRWQRLLLALVQDPLDRPITPGALPAPQVRLSARRCRRRDRSRAGPCARSPHDIGTPPPSA